MVERWLQGSKAALDDAASPWNDGKGGIDPTASEARAVVQNGR